MIKAQNFAKANSSKTDFLTSEAKKAFIDLQKAFIEALILKNFDPKYYIRIETDVLGYTIGGVLSQITLDNLDQPSSNYMTHKNVDPISSKSEIGLWHPIAFFSQKMIPAPIWYKTYDQELPTIIGTFKHWRYYLEGCKYEFFVLTDYNNFRRFMDTKSLSSHKIC